MDNLAPEDELIVDQLITASKSSAFDHVYFLGPYAQRVSFASQQHRALNLLWALRVIGEIKAGQRIAVIGAGVAGVMTAAALLDLGCEVDLYEAAGEALYRQSSATHRYIHPSISRWPEVPLCETTQVPYFDWLSGICSQVIASMKKEWIDLELGARGRLHFEPGADVTGFREPRSGKRSIAVLTVNEIKLNEKRYHTVIVTSGFSSEETGLPSDKNAKRLPTYWDSEDLVRDVTQGKIKDFLVSGSGDGGLIDCIRIAFDGFKDGAFIIEVAHMLEANEAWNAKGGGREKILKAEVKASSNRNLARSIKLGSEDLQRTYLEEADRFAPPVAEFLERALRSGRPGLVTLFSLEDVPFSPLSAPIHKLLLAFAMQGNVVDHEKARVTDWGPMFVEVQKLEKVTGAPLGPPAPRNGLAVIRHGAKPNFDRFLDEGPAKLLVDSQKQAAPKLDLPIWRNERTALLQWPPRPPFPEALERRKPQADALIHRILGMMVGRLAPVEDRGFVLRVDPDLRGSDEIVSALETLPKKIFGFDFKWVWNEPALMSPFGGDNPPSKPAEDAIRPGLGMTSALCGRLGPLVVDSKGNVFALAASHVAHSPLGPHTGLIFDANDLTVGEIAKAPPPAGRSSDVALIRISPERALEPGYGPLGPILDVADAEELFGRTVHMLDSTGEILDGSVNTTYSPAQYRLSGQADLLVIDDAVRIRPLDSTKGFGKRGDSGAPVVTSDGRLLGVLLGADAEFTYVAPVKRYLADGGLRLLDRSRAGANPDEMQVPLPELAEQARRMAEVNKRDLYEEPFLLPDYEDVEEVS